MHVRVDACEFFHVREEVAMPGDARWRWLRRRGLALFLAAVAIVLFLLFSGYLTD